MQKWQHFDKSGLFDSNLQPIFQESPPITRDLLHSVWYHQLIMSNSVLIYNYCFVILHCYFSPIYLTNHHGCLYDVSSKLSAFYVPFYLPQNLAWICTSLAAPLPTCIFTYCPMYLLFTLTVYKASYLSLCLSIHPSPNNRN